MPWIFCLNCNKYYIHESPGLKYAVVLVVLGFTTFVTSQVICVAFYSEREKSDEFCSEALISASGSFYVP